MLRQEIPSSLLLEDAILSGRMNFYGKSHKLIQMTIFYLSWIMLYGINQVPYTPEMNPIEKVWKEIRKRSFKNKVFQILEAVIDKLQEVIQGLEKSVLKSTVSRQ